MLNLIYFSNLLINNSFVIATPNSDCIKKESFFLESRLLRLHRLESIFFLESVLPSDFFYTYYNEKINLRQIYI